MEIKVRRLGFETMRLPVLNQEGPASMDLEQVCEMVDTFTERGSAYLDTIYMYHKYESERVVKKALVDRWSRDRYVLTSKLPFSHLKGEADMERFFQKQLEKCGVSYFDYYMLHNVSGSYYKAAERPGAFAFARRGKEEGKARRIGSPFHTDARLLEGILPEYPEPDFMQLQLNYIDWDSPNIQSYQRYKVCRRYGRDVIVVKPVKGGTLVDVPLEAEKLMGAHAPGMTPASWAVRFAASHEGVIMVLPGMSDYSQLLDNTAYMQDFAPLTGEEEDIVARAVEITQSAIVIACTSCQYCMEGCPEQVPMSKYFSLYNQYSLFGEKPNSRGYYQNHGGRYGKIGDCIGCRRCEAICPQHLPIVQHMREITEVFEPAR